MCVCVDVCVSVFVVVVVHFIIIERTAGWSLITSSAGVSFTHICIINAWECVQETFTPLRSHSDVVN